MKKYNFKTVTCVFLTLFIAALMACQVSVGTVENLTAPQALQLIEQRQGDSSFIILDVRTEAEYNQGHIAGALLNDYKASAFKQKLDELDRSKTFLIYCRSGNRSQGALKIMVDKGFANIYHLAGGILDWQNNKFALVKSP